MKKQRQPPVPIEITKPIWLDYITVTSKDVTCIGKKPIWLDYALAWTLPYSGPGKKIKENGIANQLMELYKQTLIKNYPTEIPVVYLNPWAVAIANQEATTNSNEPLELTVPYVTKEILWLPNDSTTMHVPHAAYWWDTALGQSRYLYERAWHNPMYRVISTIHLPYNAHHQVNRIYHPSYQTLVLHVRTSHEWDVQTTIPTSWFKQLELTTASRKLRDPRAIHLAIGAAKAKDPAALISVAKTFIYSFK